MPLTPVDYDPFDAKPPDLPVAPPADLPKPAEVKLTPVDYDPFAGMKNPPGSIFPARAIPEPEEPGYLGAVAGGLYTGVRRRLPEMVGQAIQTATSPLIGERAMEFSPATKLVNWAREGEKRPEFKSAIKEALYQGTEMLAPSVVPSLVLGPLGLGATATGAITGGLFGLSQFQQTLEEAKKAGVDPGFAPYATGAIEALGETAGTIYLTRLFGPLAPLFKANRKVTVDNVVRPTIGRLLREFPKTFAVEAGTEMGQQLGESAVEKMVGIPHEDLLKETLGVIAPTGVMTAATTAMGLPLGRIRNRGMEKALTDPQVAEPYRHGVVNSIRDAMAEADKDIAAKWKAKADLAILHHEPIPVDQDIYEYIGLGEPEKAQPESEKGAKQSGQAIPTTEPGQEEAQAGQPFDLIKNAPSEEPTRDDWKALIDQLSKVPKGKEKAAPKPGVFTPEQLGRAMGKGALNLITGQEEAEIPPAAPAPIPKAETTQAPGEGVVQPGPEGIQTTTPIPGAGAPGEIKAAGTTRPVPEAIQPETAIKEEEPKGAIPETQRPQDLNGEDLVRWLQSEKRPNLPVMALENLIQYPAQLNRNILLGEVKGYLDRRTDAYKEYREKIGESKGLADVLQPFIDEYEVAQRIYDQEMSKEKKTAIPEETKAEEPKEVKAAGTGGARGPKGAILKEEPEVSKEAKEGTAKAKAEKDREARAQTDKLISDLIAANHDDKPAAAEKLTHEQAALALVHLDALPTETPVIEAARKAVLEKYPDLKEWEKAFEQRVTTVARDGRVEGLKFTEGERTFTEAVGKGLVNDSRRHLRAQARREFPDLPLLPEETEAERKTREQIEKTKDVEINPKVKPLVDALNKADIPTSLSGDLYGKDIVYVDLPGGTYDVHDRLAGGTQEWERVLTRISAGLTKLPPGWKVIRADMTASEAFVENRPEHPYTGPRSTYTRLVRRGGAVTEEEAQAIVAAIKKIQGKEEPKEIKKAGAGPEKPKEVTEPEPPPAAAENHWERNPDTGKIELYFSKAQWDTMDAKLRERIRVRFLFAPSKKAWVSKATKDMYWPNVIVRELTAAGIFKEQKAAEEPAGEKQSAMDKDMEGLTEKELDSLLDEAFKEEEEPAEKPNERPDWEKPEEGSTPRAYDPIIITKPTSREMGIHKPSKNILPRMMVATINNPETAEDRVKKRIGKAEESKAEKVWTDGNILDRGELPYKTSAETISDRTPNATAIWDHAVAEATIPLGTPWAYHPEYTSEITKKLRMGEVFWATDASPNARSIDLKYFNYFKTKYPDAEFFGHKSAKEPRPIVVKSKGEPVGMVMPLRTNVVKKDLAEFKPEKKAFVPADDWESNLMKARMYANALKIPHVGLSLPTLVEAIKLKLSREEAKEPATAPEARPLTQILKEVGELGVKGVDEALKGLHELFGGGAMKFGVGGLDKDTYAKAKPHFEASFQAFKDAGKTLVEFFAEMKKQFGAAIKPYVRFFIQEKMGKPEAEEGKAETTAPETETEVVEEEAEDEGEITQAGTGGARGPRRKLTEQEKAEREQKKKEAEERKAKKAAMGEFKNVGYVYDPEHLNKKIQNKPPRSAAKIIMDEMAPAKVWAIDFPENASPGVVRMKNQVQEFFKSFREYLLYGPPKLIHHGLRRTPVELKLEKWANSGGQIDQLKKWAEDYGKTLQPYINAFDGQDRIFGAIGRLQQAAYPGVGTKYTWPQGHDQISKEWKSPPLHSYDFVNAYLKNGSERYIFDFLKKGWESLLGDEQDILLSEININKRGRNSNIARSGLPDYREGVDLKKTEDFQQPFTFKGVGFGEEGWINQEERNRVIPAAYDAFKDLAATLKAPDKGMSLGGDLAVQFANLGHKAHGSAAAYFPAVKTINFTRDNGDGTMAHEWGHALHDLAGPNAKDEINRIIKTLYHVFDFEAGERLAMDLLAKDSAFLKRMISSKKQQRIEAVKEEITKRFRDAVQKETDYYQVSKAMNADYTARSQEMWARAFESYIYDTLNNQAARNNYLVNDFVAAGRVGGKSGVGTMLVYPAGREREQFDATIKHLVDGLEWDENGRPFLKTDYLTIDKKNEQLMAEKLKELLDSVEERYKAIWNSEPSADGNFWYRYEVTEFAPMMQPDGFVGYDREYKGTDPTVQKGKGAVAYSTQLHPDQILDFNLSNFKYDGKNPMYIEQGGGTLKNDELQASGEVELGEVPARHGEGDEEEGDLRGDAGPGGIAGVGGTRVPARGGGATPGRPGAGGAGIPAHGPGNYRITDETLNDPKSLDARFIANLGAIRLLKELEETGRGATEREKHLLAQYSGWGGFAEIFAWTPGEAWKEKSDLVKGILDQDEMQAAASSSPSAYYTPVPAARFMWKLAQRLGFKEGLVLEPSVGANGTFFGTLPDDLVQHTQLQGIEKDDISARIAAKLYEKASVEKKGFQDANKPNNRADLTIGNVPFQNIVPADSKHNKGRYGLANYFINKMLNLNAPGTLSIVITGTGTMDSMEGHLKEYAQKADLVGAIRLPGGIYAASDVVSDILVFRKKIEGSKFKGIPVEVWTETEKVPALGGKAINKYFIQHPEMVAGKMEAAEGRYGDAGFRVIGEGDLQTHLERLAAAFPEKIVEREAVREIKSLDDLIAAPGTVKEGGIYISAKGEVAWKQGGEEVVMPTDTPAEKRKAQVARGYVGLLDQVRQLLRIQRSTTDKDQMKAEQDSLKKKYDAFVKQFGPVNFKENAVIYNDATDSPWVLALEDYDPDKKKVVKLADIFTKEILTSGQKPDHAESDHDALAMSLDEFGYPNLEYIARMRNTDPETVMKGIIDRVVENPETGFLETMDEYLSGNVRRKLDLARSMAKDNPQYERNVKLLEAAQPPEIPAHRITARIGASWVAPDHLADYVVAKLKLKPNGLKPIFNFDPISNEWFLSFTTPADRWQDGVRVENKAETERQLREAERSVEAKRIWGTQYRNFLELVKDAIQGRRPMVTFYDRNLQKTVIDPVATKGAEAKLADIQRDFQKWLFADPTRASAAVQRFNERINTSTPMIPDGSHLTFAGKGLSVLTAAESKQEGFAGKGEVLYPHQVNTVWKYLRNGNLYLAHEMGAGKTLSFALIAMEARRLRGKKKVLYVTHSDSTMDQGIAELKKAYPLANILPVRVSTNEERQQLALQKIALNDFDIAVMRQQDLDRISLSPEAEHVFIREDLAELREILEYAKAQGERIQERDIQNRITALEERLKATVHEEAKRKNLFFDDLGIDLLIVDEVHSYKNVPFATRLHGITGLNPTGSKTAHAFLRKTQYLNALYPKKDAVVVGSGTPLTNSIAELYNLQKFLHPQEMKRLGVWAFDRWIANYGEIGTELEWDGAKQEYKHVTTNRRIVNAGRLLGVVFQNLHAVQADDTPIQRPKIRGGEPKRVRIKPNEYVREYAEIVRERARNIENDARHAMHEGVPDNMLRVISDMSMVSLDQRLLKSHLGPNPYAGTPLQEESKLYESSRNIFKRWQEEKEHKGVQLVFCDRGVPHRFAAKFKKLSDEALEALSPEARKEYEDAKLEFENQATGGFNMYDALAQELVKLGIPRNEIAFIHDADHSNKDTKKANLRALFTKVNNGEIRVLVGSTSKAGTGINVQRRVSDVHHLDAWWNFSSWSQRNARGRRAGNIYTDLDGVYIWNYVTETTVDATRWDKTYSKGRTLNSVLSGDINLDVIEDMTEETLSAKLIAADASGDPLMSQHAMAMHKVQNLRLEQSAYLDNVRSSQMELSRIPGSIEANNNQIAKIKASRAVMEKVTAVRFVGDDRVLVLEKHGKEIAAALENTLLDSIQNDPKGEDRTPVLVFGSHEETEEKKIVDGKEKKVKKFTFLPIPVEAFIQPRALNPGHPEITMSGSIESAHRKLADLAYDKKGNLKEYDIQANVSRMVTEYISRAERDVEFYEGDSRKMRDRVPALKEVIETPWDKQADFEQATAKLEDIERQIAERGQTAASPEQGIPINRFEAPVPMLEDVAEKDKWRLYPVKLDTNVTEDVYWPALGARETVPFAWRSTAPLKDFSRNRAGKFDARMADRYNIPEAMQLMSGPPLRETPQVKIAGYTIRNNETLLWAKVGKGWVSVDPVHWELLDRMLAPGGGWHAGDTSRGLDEEYLVHIDATGSRDAWIQIKRAQKDAWPTALETPETPPPAAPGPGGVSFQVEEEGRAKPFYSALRRAIERKMPGPMPAKQLRAFLNQPGIKQDEMKWTGMEAWLAGKEGKVTRAEVLDFLDANEILVKEILKKSNRDLPHDVPLTHEQFEELVRVINQHELEFSENPIAEDFIREKVEAARSGDETAIDEIYSLLPPDRGDLFAAFRTYLDEHPRLKPEEMAKYGDYTLGSGTNYPEPKNYRELLLTLPTMAERSTVRRDADGSWHIFAPDGGKSVGFATQKAAQDFHDKVNERRREGGPSYTEETYRSPHWAEPNVVAHVRFSERVGSKETKFGMVSMTTHDEKVLLIEELQSDWHQAGRKRGYRPGQMEMIGGWLPTGRSGVPPAPFAKTWHEMALRRMVRWAAENGYDRIAWTPAEYHNQYYNLAQAVRQIEWERTGVEGHEEQPIITLAINPMEGDPEELYREIKQRVEGVSWDTDPDAGPLLYVPADKLEDVLGKDLATKIMTDPKDMGSFEGEGLKIGGQGMEGFYDKMVPEYLNKFGKKWGAKVEEISIETGDIAGDAEKGLTLTEDETVLRPVQSLPITEEMRRTATEEGFPLFQAPKGWDRIEGEPPPPRITSEEIKSLNDLIHKVAGVRAIFTNEILVDLRDPDTRAALKKHGWTDERLDQEIKAGYTLHTIKGSTRTIETSPGQWQAILKVAVDGKSAWSVKSTALHEAFEAARMLMLTEAEIKILDERLPGRANKAAAEIQADAFADYMLGDSGKIISRSSTALFEKIKNFFERIRNYLRGLGFQTAQDIFEGLAEGRTKIRTMAQTVEGGPVPAYQVEELNKIYAALDKLREKVYEDIRTDKQIKADPYANIARAKVIDAVEKGLKQGQSPDQIFQKLKLEANKALSDARAAGGLLIHWNRGPSDVGADVYDEVARVKMIDQVEREVRKVWPFPESPVATAFQVDDDTRKNVDALKAGVGETEAKAQEEKGFKDLIKKTRFGLVKVTDPDLKMWERILSLPYWIKDKYREFFPLVQTQMMREEKRSELIHRILKQADPFLTLRGAQVANVEKAIIAGDRMGKVWSEPVLRDKFGLDIIGIKAYQAARQTLDWIHREWRDKIEANFLKEFEKERWFGLFKAAHGLDLNTEETTRMAEALKKTYQAHEKPIETVRQHLQKVFREKLTQEDKRLLVKNYVEAYNATRKQMEEIKSIVRASIGEDLNEKDLDKEVKALVMAYIRTEPAANQLKEMRDELNQLGGYFPRSRKEGKYRVIVSTTMTNDAGADVSVPLHYETAANRIEATRLYDKLKKMPEYEGMKFSVEPTRKEAESSFMGASSMALQRLVDNAIDKLKAQGTVDIDTASAIRLNVLETLADELKARGAGRFAIQRADNIIEGYQKTNLKEVLKDYIDGWAGMMTKQDAALEFLEALKGIPRSKPQLMAYASKYAQDMLRNQERMDQISQKMRSLAFIYFLGGSLRAATVNFTQNYITGIPFLAREVGAKSLKAEKLYHQAMFNVATGKGLSALERRMIDEMINKGIAEDQYIRQITREVKSGLSQQVGHVVDLLGKPFSWMERFNRKSAALAMFRVKYEAAVKSGKKEEAAYRQAFDAAQDYVYKVHYLMTKANLPSVAAGGDVGSQFLKTAYTFRRFTHNYLLSLYHSFTGPDGKVALDVMGRSLAYIALLGGLPAIPFLDDLLDLWEKFFGTPVRSNMRKTLRDAGGPVLEKMGMAGIPALMGIDISGSLKTGVPGLGYGTPADTVYGVYGGMGKKALNAMNAAERDDYLRALEFASPSFMESILKAYRMADRGATTPTGNVLTDEQGKPIRLSASEAAAQAMGFRPDRMAQISGEHWTMENVKKHFAEKRNALYARFRLAKTQEEQRGVIRDMQKFNMETRKYRGIVSPITMTSLRQTASQKPERGFMAFGRMMEASF